MDLNSKEKELKSNLDWIKRNWVGFVIGFGLCAAIVLALLGFNIISFKSQANLSQTVNLGTVPATSEVTKNPCKEEVFTETTDRWTTKQYDKPDEEGFYCLSYFSKFSSPDLWYKNLIPTNFDSIEIRYELKNKDNNITNPPSFIFSIGRGGAISKEENYILRLYVPEKSYQIVGFEKITKKDDGFSLEREEVKDLDEPIEYGTEAELKVRIRIVEGNKARFDFNLQYISARNGRSVEKGFSYDVDIPVPGPESELSKLQIGFGTFKGSCVKPLSYKFCY